MINKESAFKQTPLKKIIFLFLSFMLIVSISWLSFPANIFGETSDEVKITAESALVVDFETGNILYEKNSNKKIFPASTTKMLTAIVAIENISDYSEVVKISKNASGRNHSAFKFSKGGEISLMDLLKASLICSHNNATIALAEYVCGNVEDFVKMMNLKAKEIGAVNSNFKNTNGLDSEYPNHKTTAYDLALIAKYCLSNNLFKQIVNTQKDYIHINGKEIEIKSTNDLLSYDYIGGVKTGYTENAGFCIVLYSDKNDLELITVVLGCSSVEDRKNDSIRLLNWAYDNFDYVNIVDSSKVYKTINIGDQTKVYVDLCPDSDFTKLININSDEISLKHDIDDDIKLPVLKNQVLGTLDVYINDDKQADIRLISKDAIEKPYVYQKIDNNKELQSRKMLFFLLVFYFFVFTFIIVKNLFVNRNQYY
jgi:D-alanyl-D-alanine carboxypeptidase (penicillin-binding protein 5/6)